MRWYGYIGLCVSVIAVGLGGAQADPRGVHKDAAAPGNCKAVYMKEAKRKDIPSGERKFAHVLTVCREEADQGNAEATFLVGLMHRNGHGVPLDRAEAAKWHRLAAQRGSLIGALFLGGYYENGFGVTQDYGEAVKWYRIAAEGGSAGALSSLAKMYETGRGVQRDYIQAYMLYDMAYVLADIEKNELNSIFSARFRERVAKKMSPDNISKAQRLARECEKKNYRGCGF